MAQIYLFGTSGMDRKGALQEFLLSPEVDQGPSAGRSPPGQGRPEPRDLVVQDLTQVGPSEYRLRGYDAAFFHLEVASAPRLPAEVRVPRSYVVPGLSRLEPGMGQLSDALQTAGRELEARLRAHQREMMKDGLGSALPQSWRFETESESAVLRLDISGGASVSADVIEHPAVIVRWTQASLVAALLSGRSNEQPRQPSPTIRFTSDAGRKAFSMLGTSLGL